MVKKDASIRFCVDYCKVNEVSEFDTYYMPQVDELLDWIGWFFHSTGFNSLKPDGSAGFVCQIILTLEPLAQFLKIPIAPEGINSVLFPVMLGSLQ